MFDFPRDYFPKTMEDIAPVVKPVHKPAKSVT
jgi:hypothetical protein